MERRPAPGPIPLDPQALQQPGLHGRGASRPVATDQSDIVQPFLVSGGFRRFFPYDDKKYDIGQNDGIQLVTSVYVPTGKIGFIKQLRVAPLKPAVLSDPWQLAGLPLETDGVDYWPRASWRAASEMDNSLRYYPDVWRSPFEWEGLVHLDDEGALTYTTKWTWQISYLPGTIEQIRNARNLPPFDPTILASYYLVPDVPADFTISYGSAVPGGLTGVIMSPQRYQVVDANELTWHIPIPENTTACLFARWSQDTVRIGYNSNASDNSIFVGTYVDAGHLDQFYPLGPSVGQMSGYMQPVASKGSVQNAVYGWGG